jgi:hypothetical protein
MLVMPLVTTMGVTFSNIVHQCIDELLACIYFSGIAARECRIFLGVVAGLR